MDLKRGVVSQLVPQPPWTIDDNGSCFIVKDDDGKKTDRVPVKTDGLGDRFLGNWWGQPSSGNRAFDDYRAETLRRLEDEQREFKEFLKRLRVARDRAEFDQFMNDRHLDAPFASRRAI